MKRFQCRIVLCSILTSVAVSLCATPVRAQSASTENPQQAEKDKLVALNKKKTVLLDMKKKRLVLKTQVVLREGLLEMLCCLKQTKEHESVVAVDARAYVVHTGLLALGAKTGTPVRFDPKYQPPTGQEIKIYASWRDKKGKRHRVEGQQLVRTAIRRFYAVELAPLPKDVTIPKDSELRYDRKHKELSWFGHMTEKQRDELLGLSKDKEFQKAIKSFYKESQPRAMDAKFVFAGSGFFVDEKTGEKTYLAENGNLICVANFPSATIDVDIASSSQGRQNQLFEAYTEHIPPLGTEVTLELIPVFEKKDAEEK